MVSINAFGQRLSIVSGHPATSKTNFLRGVPYHAAKGGLAGTKPQIRARTALAENSIKFRGKKNLVDIGGGRMTTHAGVSAMTVLRGKHYYEEGDVTPAQRREGRYAAADSFVNAAKQKVTA